MYVCVQYFQKKKRKNAYKPKTEKKNSVFSNLTQKRFFKFPKLGQIMIFLAGIITIFVFDRLFKKTVFIGVVDVN